MFGFTWFVFLLPHEINIQFSNTGDVVNMQPHLRLIFTCLGRYYIIVYCTHARTHTRTHARATLSRRLYNCMYLHMPVASDI